MYRRQFLHNAGFIFPAVVLAPSMVLATEVTQATVLFIQQSSLGNQEMVADVLKAAGSMRILKASAVKEVISVCNGFTVVMVNGEQYSTGKIIFQAPYKVMQEQSAVAVDKEGKVLQLPYGARGSNQPAEFWALGVSKLDKERVSSFMKRNGAAFMCVA